MKLLKRAGRAGGGGTFLPGSDPLLAGGGGVKLSGSKAPASRNSPGSKVRVGASSSPSSSSSIGIIGSPLAEAWAAAIGFATRRVVSSLSSSLSAQPGGQFALGIGF